LPEGLTALTNLIELDLNLNYFHNGEIPEVVFKLTSLRTLDVRLCGLQSLPDNLSSLKLLTDINFSNNNFSHTPSVITTLPSLRRINGKFLNKTDVDDNLNNILGGTRMEDID